MREIKFRAKRKDDTPHNGKWVYGQYFVTPLTDENSGAPADAGWYFLSGEQRHCIVQDGVSFVIDVSTLGQYTGLDDTSGKKIWEGDIVKERIGFGTESRIPKNKPYVFSLGVIEWDEERWIISHKLNNEQYWKDVKGNGTDWYRVHYGLRKVEVIGNTCDNRALLSKKCDGV